MMPFNTDIVNKKSKWTYFTIYNQNCAIHELQCVHRSCLTGVCCFIFFANILDVKKIQIIPFCDCKSWGIKRSSQWYPVKCSCCNSLDHISTFHLIPVKQSRFIPEDWTCHRQIIARLKHSQCDLVGNV